MDEFRLPGECIFWRERVVKNQLIFFILVRLNLQNLQVAPAFAGRQADGALIIEFL